MLLHKQTMGVLTLFWTGVLRSGGPGGVKVPVLAPYTPENVPDFDPDDWWEVRGSTTLGRRLLKCYPFCDPVVGENGELLDIVPWPDWKIYGEPEPARGAVSAGRTKQKRRRKPL